MPMSGFSEQTCSVLPCGGLRTFVAMNPFTPNAERRFHLFGGRLRTGNAGEYGIAWGIVGVCFVLAMLFKPGGGSGWYPFFYDWHGLYQSGVVDAKEWKDNRLKFF